MAHTFAVNDRVKHLDYGFGTVIGVDGKAVQVRFDNGRNHTLDEWYLFALSPEMDAKRQAENLRRLEETFRESDPKGAHGHGGHWEPFFDHSEQWLCGLQTIVEEASLLVYPCDTQKQRVIFDPAEPVGIIMAWPILRQGMGLVIKIMKDGPNEIVSAYPRVSDGVPYNLTVEKVHLWDGRLEAQIETSWAGASLVFFDTLFARQKAYYTSGKTAEFILAGIAYNCWIARAEPIIITDPQAVRNLRYPELLGRQFDSIGELDLSPVELQVKGMTIFMQHSDGDRDDYAFRGTVKEVEETEMFGKKTWRFRTTVLRSIVGDSAFDLDIYVTEKSLKDIRVPEVGSEIEGVLWLQGYMWNSCNYENW